MLIAITLSILATAVFGGAKAVKSDRVVIEPSPVEHKDEPKA